MASPAPRSTPVRVHAPAPSWVRAPPGRRPPVARHRRRGIAPDRALEPEHVLVVDAHARDAEHGAVAEEDLRERAAHDRLDAPLLERLRGVLAGGPAPEVEPGQ